MIKGEWKSTGEPLKSSYDIIMDRKGPLIKQDATQVGDTCARQETENRVYKICQCETRTYVLCTMKVGLIYNRGRIKLSAS